MSETQTGGSEATYRVQVGLAECTVSGRTEQEAVRKAREKLNRDMPHMATVIGGILDKHFRVDRVT